MSDPVKRLSSGSPFEEVAGYCRAVRAGGLVLVSGTAAIDEHGNVLHPGDTYLQAVAALGRALDAAGQLGASREDVIRTRLLLAPEADWRQAARAHGEVFTSARPANTTLFVHGFIPEGCLLEVELDSVYDEGDG